MAGRHAVADREGSPAPAAGCRGEVVPESARAGHPRPRGETRLPVSVDLRPDRGNVGLVHVRTHVPAPDPGPGPDPATVRGTRPNRVHAARGRSRTVAA